MALSVIPLTTFNLTGLHGRTAGVNLSSPPIDTADRAGGPGEEGNEDEEQGDLTVGTGLVHAYKGLKWKRGCRLEREGGRL